jgi:hypothetical protein
MPEGKDQDLRDIQAEEITRGKKQPKKALSLARRPLDARNECVCPVLQQAE